MTRANDKKTKSLTVCRLRFVPKNPTYTSFVEHVPCGDEGVIQSRIHEHMCHPISMVCNAANVDKVMADFRLCVNRLMMGVPDIVIKMGREFCWLLESSNCIGSRPITSLSTRQVAQSPGDASSVSGLLRHFLRVTQTNISLRPSCKLYEAGKDYKNVADSEALLKSPPRMPSATNIHENRQFRWMVQTQIRTAPALCLALDE